MFGLGQPLADGLKFIFKEEFTPSHVDKPLYILAPLVDPDRGPGHLRRHSVRQRVAAIGLCGVQRTDSAGGRARLDVGMIYVFALSSIAVYGVILGGWASNNKYSFLGALRSSAQLIAYELPMGLGILGVVLLAGSLRLEYIIAQQARTASGTLSSSPSAFSCSSSPPSPKPPACRSTCPKPSKS